MKVGILTFYFAHNYGAMLQAYALKRFLLISGIEAEIIPYYPKWAQKEYAISPFEKKISLKKRIRFTIQYPQRKRIASKFEEFKRHSLTDANSYNSHEELIETLNQFDYVIFGSDQIWNDNITGRVSDYYGGDSMTKRISYAASLGTKQLTEWQQKCAGKYLSNFTSISVREPHSKALLEQIVHKPIETVLDPVFLISEESWISECASVDVEDHFMLLYLLKEDDDLLQKAYEYAAQNGLIIYEIHPTLVRFHPECQKLIDIGPREFLWLIQNAQCICTNSFHAVSFSMIFGKKLLHIPNANSPERTTSLLDRMGYSLIQNNSILPLYNLSSRDRNRLESLSIDSKRFLLDSL